MTHTAKGLLRLSVAAVVGGMALFWSGDITLSPQGSLVSSAHAIIGRPLTPMSYAGVARRTTRRAYAYGGAVYAAPMVVAPGPVVVAPRCVQAVDAYGRLYTRCY
jgi:hypothetical protein